VQLQVIHRPEIVTNLMYENVVQQSFEPICGVMSIAFAFSCVLGHNPTNISYDIKSVRSHLNPDNYFHSQI
jgi:hypothetical protein